LKHTGADEHACAREAADADDGQQHAAEAVAQQQRALAEEHHRKKLLADDARRFEELYRQNRTILTAHRSKEGRQQAHIEGSPTSLKTVRPANAANRLVNTMEDDRKSSQDHVKGDKEMYSNSFSWDSGRNAAEIVAFAQKLSALTPATRGGSLELDEKATFFTET